MDETYGRKQDSGAFIYSIFMKCHDWNTSLPHVETDEL